MIHETPEHTLLRDAGELANEVVHACQQFHGGMGYIRETAIERLWRRRR